MGMSAYAKLQTMLYSLTTDAVATRPTSWTLSLHSGDPGTDGTANEIADANYLRQSIAFSEDVTDPANPFLENSAVVNFPAAAAAYTVTHIVVWDNADNPQVIQQLRTPKSIAIAEVATLSAGELTIGR